MFLIYANDINRHVHLGSCNIYADDTLIYCTGNNITELKYNIQKCVTDVHEWYESNKLVINTSKSNVMLLTTRQMLSNMRDTALNVFIGNHKLPQCNSIKYLGVEIDNVLSWNLQTDSISKKLVFIISRLSRLKPVLPSQMLMYFYTSIIQPKIDYAISIWGYTTAHNINKVQRLQNRAARILTGNFDYVNTRGIDLVKNLGMMNVTQRRDYFMLIMIIMLYYRLAEHINKYMSVVQYIVSTLSTKVGIQLLTMSVATMRRAHTATVSNENEFVRSTLHLKPVQL